MKILFLYLITKNIKKEKFKQSSKKKKIHGVCVATTTTTTKKTYVSPTSVI